MTRCDVEGCDREGSVRTIYRNRRLCPEHYTARVRRGFQDGYDEGLFTRNVEAWDRENPSRKDAGERTA